LKKLIFVHYAFTQIIETQY